MARKKASANAAWASDPQYLAFESDIVAHPDDDAPRLILADWLDDHGDEHTAARAEFIRLQIERSRLPKSDSRIPDLQNRERELLQKHEKAWLGKLADLVTDAYWERGFVQRLKLGVRQFMENADELFRLAPILHLQLLRISQTKMSMSELAGCPHFARLRGLTLPGSSIGDEKLAVLLGEANLENIETLVLSGAEAASKTLQALATASLPRLRTLNLARNYLQRHLGNLCKKNISFQLRTLDLGGNGLNTEDRAALFAWPGLQTVENLNLSGTRLGTAGGAELGSCPHLKALRRLNLYGCEIGARGIEAIADARALAGIEELELGFNSIRPTGLPALLRCAFIDRLDALNLASNLLSDASMKRLANWPGLAHCTRLNLAGNRIGPAGIETLCASPYIVNLTSLNLTSNEITAQGASVLGSCSRLAKLKTLNVSLCGLRDKPTEALSNSSHLVGLTQLYAYGNILSNGCIKRLEARFPSIVDWSVNLEE